MIVLNYIQTGLFCISVLDYITWAATVNKIHLIIKNKTKRCLDFNLKCVHCILHFICSEAEKHQSVIKCVCESAFS